MCALLFFAILLAPFVLGAVIYFCQREYIRRWCLDILSPLKE